MTLQKEIIGNMKVDIKRVTPMLNNAYLAGGYSWPAYGDGMIQFKHTIERESGLRLKFESSYDPTGRFQYRLDEAEVLDEKLYLLFCIKYAA
jgi:hypothetical protein